MGTRQGPLSDLQLRRWLKDGQQLARSDGNGLTFTASSAGGATWVLRYSHGNRRYELTLGRYPGITLSEARAMAAVKRADVFKGASPVAERRKPKAAAIKDWTVRELIKDYKEKVLVNFAKSTRICYTRHLGRIENRLGSLGARKRQGKAIETIGQEVERIGRVRQSGIAYLVDIGRPHWWRHFTT